MPLINRLQSTFNVWYMDDGSIGDNADVLLNDFQLLIAEGKNLGLNVNTAKCELIIDDEFVLEKFRTVAPDISHVLPSDAVLLGAPIGGESSMDKVLLIRLNELRRLSDRIQFLDTHDALFLLKNCFAIPKLMYTLRGSPCFSNNWLKEYDEVIRFTLQYVLNISLSDEAWNQASLPVASGGLGIRKATQVALPAFLSSVCGSQSIIKQLLPQNLYKLDGGTNDLAFTYALREWENRTCSSIHTSISINQMSQKEWDLPVIKIQESEVLSAAPDQAGKARLLAAAAPHSGAFLHVRPCSSIGTRLDSTTLRIAVALRLGAPVCSTHTCVCGSTVDTTGRHGLSCRKSAGRLSRHHALNDLIKRALSSAEIPSRLEPSSLARDDGKRPDGLSLIPWANGRCLVWDVTCPDTLSSSHLNAAVSGHGTVATESEERKRQKYTCLSTTYCFVPVAIETFGSLGETAIDFLRDLGRRIAKVTGERRATEFLLQRISCAIQRGNAACVLGTAADNDSDNLDDIFYL